MGTWGSGNFENDAALDYAGQLVDQLADRVDELLEDDAADLDEEGEGVLMPSIAFIAALVQESQCSPPDAARIRGWRESYLMIFDEQIDGLDPDPAFKIDRRRVIEHTFDRLIALAARAEENAE